MTTLKKGSHKIRFYADRKGGHWINDGGHFWTWKKVTRKEGVERFLDCLENGYERI